MALIDYSLQLHALLGQCVDTSLLEPRIIFQAMYKIDWSNPAVALDAAAQEITAEMHRWGFTRVNPVVRPTSQWLDVNCLFA